MSPTASHTEKQCHPLFFFFFLAEEEKDTDVQPLQVGTLGCILDHCKTADVGGKLTIRNAFDLKLHRDGNVIRQRVPCFMSASFAVVLLSRCNWE